MALDMCPDNPDSIDYALLLGEMEGVCTHLKRLKGFDDLAVVEEMKKRYYKAYFQKKREETKES